MKFLSSIVCGSLLVISPTTYAVNLSKFTRNPFASRNREASSSGNEASAYAEQVAARREEPERLFARKDKRVGRSPGKPWIQSKIDRQNTEPERAQPVVLSSNGQAVALSDFQQSKKPSLFKRMFRSKSNN